MSHYYTPDLSMGSLTDNEPVLAMAPGERLVERDAPLIARTSPGEKDVKKSTNEIDGHEVAPTKKDNSALALNGPKTKKSETTHKQP